MTTQEYLASFGVSMQAARDFINANISNPGIIYNTAKQYGIDSQMLADIMAPQLPGLTARQVENFFDSHQLDGSLLSPDSNARLFSSDYSELAELVNFNTETGQFSNQSLRASVVAISGVTNYRKAFSPDKFYGSEDGVITPQESQLNHLPAFAATFENMESLYYGTLVRMIRAIDLEEVQQLEQFTDQHDAALALGDAATHAQLLAIVVDMFKDPATNPVITDAEMRQDLVDVTAELVTLIGSSDLQNIFDGFFSGVTSY